MKTTIRLFISSFALCLLSVATPKALAVVPPPDGGYPNFNTAEGQNALFSLTSGAANTAVGWFSLHTVTTGNFNTGLGAGALVLNTGNENTAIGAAALLLNTASGNTAVGSRALVNNTTGGTLGNIQGFDFGPNVAVGQGALENNTVASANTAVGYQALNSFMTGPTGAEQIGACTAVGFQALANSTGTGVANTGLGYAALKNNTDGGGNTAIGIQALLSNTTGNGNTAVGGQTLAINISGNSNTAVGTGALASNLTDENTATGSSALTANTTGGENVANGRAALLQNTTGIANTAIGWQALANNQTGNANVALGKNAGASSTGDANVYIGADMTGVAGESNACYIRSIFGETSVNGAAVLVNADNKLGTLTSSKRFKDEIKPMAKASEALFALKPVSFRYKKDIDPARTSQLGLVAEDVERVNPDLVVHDKEGKPYSVRYDQVNAMLLNEFLKEHGKVEQLEVIVADLAKQVRQLQINSPSDRVAANHQ